MILGGLALIAAGARDLWRALASPSWPVVPGVIRESEVTKRTSSGSGSSRGSTTHYINLTAGYRVNGRDYETGRIYYGFSGGSGDASAIELEHLRYPAGAKVSVSHHPRDAAIAVLRPGFDLDAAGVATAGLAIALIGFALALVFLGAFKEYSVLPLGVRVFGLVFLVAGGAMLTSGLVRYWNAHESRSWPVTTGSIVYAEEHSSTGDVKDSDGEGTSLASHGAPLAHRYRVNGKTCFSNTQRFGAPSGASQDWARSILRRYPSGAGAPVSYNPADPNTAVLEPGRSSELLWLPGAGAGLLLFGLAAVILGFRM